MTWLHNRLVRKLKWREARLKQAQIIAEAPITEDEIIRDLRKLFKNPCSQAELNKIVPFGFSLQRQKMVFFCHQNSIILLC